MNTKSEEIEKQTNTLEETTESAKLRCPMLSDLTAKSLVDLIGQLDELGHKDKAALLDVDFYVQQHNIRNPLSPVTDFTNYLKEYGVDTYEFVSRDCLGIRLVYENFTLECVDQEGGGEGDGEHWHSVIKAESRSEPGKARYFYIPGYYASYDGTTIEYHDAYEVEPYEKTVIDWKKA